jgi:hypothetical protein
LAGFSMACGPRRGPRRGPGGAWNGARLAARLRTLGRARRQGAPSSGGQQRGCFTQRPSQTGIRPDELLATAARPTAARQRVAPAAPFENSYSARREHATTTIAVCKRAGARIWRMGAHAASSRGAPSRACARRLGPRTGPAARATERQVARRRRRGRPCRTAQARCKPGLTMRAVAARADAATARAGTAGALWAS